MNFRNIKLSRILGASIALYGINTFIGSIYSVNNPTIDVYYNQKSWINKALAEDKDGFMKLIKSFKPCWFYAYPLTGAISNAFVINPHELILKRITLKSSSC